MLFVVFTALIGLAISKEGTSTSIVFSLSPFRYTSAVPTLITFSPASREYTG